MKRKVLVLMVPVSLTTNAVSAVEIYNNDGSKLDLYEKVDGLHCFSDNTSEDGDQTYAHFSIKGETQTVSELTGYGQWECNIQVNTTEKEDASSWIRLTFADLGFVDYDSLDYGRNYDAVYDIESRTDMLPELGGDTYTQIDVYMIGRTSGVTAYRNSDFSDLTDGLYFVLQYQGNNENAGSGEDTSSGGKRKLAWENGNGLGISGYYDLDMGISVGTAYSPSDRAHNQLAEARSSQRYANGDKADAWIVGVKYDANNIYLAVIYIETRNMTFYGNDSFDGIANKTQNFEVVTQYQFNDFNLPPRPSVAYLRSKGKDLYTYSCYGGKDLAKYIDVGTAYYFSENMSIYVDYRINLLDEGDRFCENSGITTDDVVVLNLVYQF